MVEMSVTTEVRTANNAAINVVHHFTFSHVGGGSYAMHCEAGVTGFIYTLYLMVYKYVEF